ncbi:MAG: hypothetical protein GXO63_02355 [Candidatus Micrarchaeota archaeon]|nr:hypothetical protein [Candidatus Micrarchaeota archaeon]
MIELYYTVLNAVFSPLLVLGPAVAEAVIAVMLSFFSVLFYRYFSDHTRLREIERKLKKTEKTEEVLELVRERFRLSMKPMIFGMLLVLAFIPWISHTFSGPVVELPFSLPLLGSDIGWLAWYIIVSIPATLIFRKTLLGV